MSTEIKPVPDVVLAPEFPSLSDRQAGLYNQKAKAWADGENAMAQSVREVALNVENNAIAAGERAVAANADADRAEAAADAATAISGAEEWQSGKVYQVGDVVWSPLDFQSYRRRTEGAGTVDPSIDADNWVGVGGARLDSSPTVDFTAELGRRYWLRGSFEVTLPDSTNLSVGNFVSFSKALEATPIITVGAGPAVIQTAKGADTSVLFDINAEITFTFNGTDWEV